MASKQKKAYICTIIGHTYNYKQCKFQIYVKATNQNHNRVTSLHYRGKS